MDDLDKFIKALNKLREMDGREISDSNMNGNMQPSLRERLSANGDDTDKANARLRMEQGAQDEAAFDVWANDVLNRLLGDI